MRRLLALAVLLVAVPAAAQSSADLVTWRVRVDRAAPGATARLVLDAEVAEGWQLYGLGSAVGVPLSVTLDGLPAGVTAGRIAQVGARDGYDEVFEARYPYFVGRGRVVQRLAVAAGATRGTHEVTGRVRYAVCDDSVCLPPVTTAFRVPLVVE